MDDNCKTTVKPKSPKDFFKSKYFWKPFLGITIGAIAGFMFYYFIGCESGSCAITSSPLGSIITGSFFGFFVTSSPCSRC